MQSLKQDVLLAYCSGLAFDLLGVVSADWQSMQYLRQTYEEWLAQGYAGSMSFLSHHKEVKFDPLSLMRDARSVIVTGLNYYQQAQWERGVLCTETKTGRIARYAWGRDYHKVLKKELFKLDQTIRRDFPDMNSRLFVDSGPLHERLAAEGAGLAFTGKHTLSINHELGSWFFLGVLITDLDIEVTGNLSVLSQSIPHPQGKCPSGCQRCMDICPTGALLGPKRIDAARCISYLTIEHKGSIPLELRPLMGDWIFGCDLCQEVCPFNIKGEQTEVEDFLTWRAGDRIDLQEILDIPDDDAFTARFAGSPLMRAKRENLVRNACIAAANAGRVDLEPVLKKLANNDDSPVVREHAQWGLTQLKGE